MCHKVLNYTGTTVTAAAATNGKSRIRPKLLNR